jgi:hypothetical protein
MVLVNQAVVLRLLSGRARDRPPGTRARLARHRPDRARDPGSAAGRGQTPDAAVCGRSTPSGLPALARGLPWTSSAGTRSVKAQRRLVGDPGASITRCRTRLGQEPACKGASHQRDRGRGSRNGRRRGLRLHRQPLGPATSAVTAVFAAAVAPPPGRWRLPRADRHLTFARRPHGAVGAGQRRPPGGRARNLLVRLSNVVGATLGRSGPRRFRRQTTVSSATSLREATLARPVDVTSPVFPPPSPSRSVCHRRRHRHPWRQRLPGLTARDVAGERQNIPGCQRRPAVEATDVLREPGQSVNTAIAADGRRATVTLLDDDAGRISTSTTPRWSAMCCDGPRQQRQRRHGPDRPGDSTPDGALTRLRVRRHLCGPGLLPGRNVTLGPSATGVHLRPQSRQSCRRRPQMYILTTSRSRTGDSAMRGGRRGRHRGFHGATSATWHASPTAPRTTTLALDGADSHAGAGCFRLNPGSSAWSVGQLGVHGPGRHSVVQKSTDGATMASGSTTGPAD